MAAERNVATVVTKRRNAICILAMISLMFTLNTTVVAEVPNDKGSAMQQTRKKEGDLIILDENLKMRLIEKAKSLRCGNTVEQVKAALGPPTEDNKVLGKKGEFITRLVRYYIRKDDRFVNEKTDFYVSFYFDESDKLVDIGYKLNERPQVFTPHTLKNK